MKKRIFTLLAIGMLIGGISSTLNAQTEVVNVNVGKAVFGEGSVFEVKAKDNAQEKPWAISKTRLSITVRGANLIAKDTTIILSISGAANYLGFPSSVTIKPAFFATDTTYHFDFDHNWDMPDAESGSSGLVYAYVKRPTPPATLVGDTAIYYNYPTFTVEYMPITANYSGVLRVSSITGSNPAYSTYMDRTLKSYAYTKDTTVFIPFSDIEIANLIVGEKILVTAPWETYTLDIPGIKDEQDPTTITRPVNIPAVSNAILNVETGVKYVPSAEDFSFTIKPTGSNEGLKPVVKTDRTSIPDSEGVTYKKLSDGSWLITIIRVQSAINLTISFTDDVSNASIESNSVWANGGQLYVSAVTSSKASIYSITGALVKTASIAAGETANISLPTGFYVVTVNGKAYKVTVK